MKSSSIVVLFKVYIPELGMTFQVQREKTRLFACQNPLNQGGGRKGLPKSFLNRFTQVKVRNLSLVLLLIAIISEFQSAVIRSSLFES